MPNDTRKNNMISVRTLSLIVGILLATAAAVGGVLKLHASQAIKIERLDAQAEAHDKALTNVSVSLVGVNVQMTKVQVELGKLQTSQSGFKDEVLRALKKRDVLSTSLNP